MGKRKPRNGSADAHGHSKSKMKTRFERQFAGCVDDVPDSTSREFYYDDAETFQHEKDEVLLTPRYSGRRNYSSVNQSTKEILSVRVDDGLDHNSDDEAVDDYSDANDEGDDESDMQSDLDDEDVASDEGLPSADAWGKKRAAYYDTDYVDKDYGGFTDSEDEELALAEEQEAKSLHRRLREQLCEDDFALDDYDLPAEGQSSASQIFVAEDKSRDPTNDGVAVSIEPSDLSEMSEKDQLKLLAQQSPECLTFLEELKRARNNARTLQPLIEILKENPSIAQRPGFQLIQNKFEASLNYVLNLNCYVFHILKGVSVQSHPLVQRILQWKKIIDKIDAKMQCIEAEVELLLSRLQNGEIISQILRDSDVQETVDVSAIKAKKNAIRSLKKSGQYSSRTHGQNHLDPQTSGTFEECEGDEKRGITYQMMKNKGLMPRRKKEQRNPRVKHRLKFRKALIRRKSQVPDVKRELVRYGGEARGIKTSVIRSIKLS